MKKRDIAFSLLAASIALVSNAIIFGVQGSFDLQSLVAKSSMSMILAICPFVLGAGLIENQTSILIGAVSGIIATALLWGFFILISIAEQSILDLDTGPIMLLLSMPFIVTSVFLVTALLKERLASR